MKTAAILVLAASAFVLADEDPIKQLCRKAGTSFCVDNDVILHCSGECEGQLDSCGGANLSGYSPRGSTVNCYEKAKGDGMAACQNNCIAHAEPSSTLATEQCKPSAASTLLPLTSAPHATPFSTPKVSNNGTIPVVTAGASKNLVGGAAVAGMLAAYML